MLIINPMKKKSFLEKVIEELNQEKMIKKALDIITKYNSLSEAKNCLKFIQKSERNFKKLPQNNINSALSTYAILCKRNNLS